jgi:sulfide:quinone oxidoreductase
MMSVSDAMSSPTRVLIAGGGIAAVEAALALRALAGDRVGLTLISPDPVLQYRPAATLAAFDDRIPLRYDLRAIAADVGAVYQKTLLKSVAPKKRYVRTASGSRLEYDALVLATGARAIAGIPGATTFRDHRDLPLIRRLLADVDSEAVRRIVFAVPTGVSWPLPMYELALLLAARASERGLDGEVSLVTPERDPLEVFGPHASVLVRGVLEDGGVRFIGAVEASGVRRDGTLLLETGDLIRADRVVAVPRLRGRRIVGVPASRSGFVPTHSYGRVDGVEAVYAAGDVTTFPIKQGGLAAQQADRVAQAIAAGAAVSTKELRAGHVLLARLIGGRSPLILRTELDAWGRPGAAQLERIDKRRATSSNKVLARYLAPYLETCEPLPAGPPEAA